MNAVIDIECDGLTPKIIHCLNYRNIDTGEKGSFTSYEDMIKFLLGLKVIIGHNIIRFDIPVLERLLGISFKNVRKVDTLVLSWYLYPTRMRHGLESFGDEFGIKKPYILDWEGLSIEEYQNRCGIDVEINYKLWKDQYKYLLDLYKTPKNLWVFLKYLEKKITVVRLQEKSRWKLDIENVEKTLKALRSEQEHKVNILKDILPKVPIIRTREKPKKMFTVSGDLTKLGHQWLSLLDEHKLPLDYADTIDVVTGETEGNPNSPDQIKSWLFSIGWTPETYKYVKEDDGSTRPIPQVNQEHGKGICPSILKLKLSHPEVEHLEGLGIIQHRIGILNGFLRDQKDGFLYATLDGLTNTLRSKHKVIVNLPKVNKAYATGVRSSLIARDSNILCGSDMKSLEDRLKQHFMFPIDPAYVNSMDQEDFDPHLIVAVLAGMMTQQQADDYKKGDKTNKSIRDTAKNGNYACQYGAGPARLVTTCGITFEQAERLHKAYWDLNRAIRIIASDQTYKRIGDQLWLYNPISGFWYSLRYTKDIFSTLIQGTASYVFDLWVFKILEEREQITATFHDEIVLEVKDGRQDYVTDILRRAIKSVNEELNLNKQLDIDIQFGVNYGEIH